MEIYLDPRRIYLETRKIKVDPVRINPDLRAIYLFPGYQYLWIVQIK